jgi:integrase
MKMPNGYGGVVKLPGKRRKPWAVRISYVDTQPDGLLKRKRKYLEYFTTQKEALAYLADYNKGLAVSEHVSLTDMLTFKELFDRWIEWKWSFKKHPGNAAKMSYNAAFKLYASIHDRKVVSLRTSDLQECISNNSSMSQSSISNMGVIVRGMWKYAISNEYVDRDITAGIVYEYAASNTSKHTRFTDDEITLLWKSLGHVPNVDIVLIYIYTGMRATELLSMRKENVHLDKHYMIGGVKTAAGRDRVIPIHNAILPLVKNLYDNAQEYFIPTPRGKMYSTTNFRVNIFAPVMEALHMEHITHDCRYTFVSLANACSMDEICLKIIVGHSLANTSGTAFKIGGTGDVTKNIYTEKNISELVDAVNLIPVSVTHL